MEKLPYILERNDFQPRILYPVKTNKYEGRGKKVHFQTSQKISHVCYFRKLSSFLYHNEVEKKEEDMDPGNGGN